MKLFLNAWPVKLMLAKFTFGACIKNYDREIDAIATTTTKTEMSITYVKKRVYSHIQSYSINKCLKM